MRFPTTIRSLEFSLNRGLGMPDSTADIEQIDTGRSRHARYRVSLPAGEQQLTLRYRGKPLFSGRKSLGRMPDGILSEAGIYLDGNSAWYPLSKLPVTRVDLDITHPTKWRVLSVGRLEEKTNGSRWYSSVPHDELYLIAGPFERYALKHQGLDMSVWLLGKDDKLANRYLGLMGEYIDHYSNLIGPYPFAKFAVVENPWQTGFGMPSFTLLGSRVLRLPFIPFTSLPHEIAHNWLGNGIWVDHRKGNWSEGLTAYLADHWMKERRGKGSQHRLKSLQRYTNFADDGRDSPLLDFVSRHNDTSQAVGYDKSMMLFHMIRRSLGEDAFATALQRLWRRHRFEPIGFEQAVSTLLEERPGLLRPYLAWVKTVKVPRLRLDQVRLTQAQGRYQLDLRIGQQLDPPLEFELPLLVTLQEGQPARRSVHRIRQGSTRLSLTFDSPPLRLDIDPAFDVLRYLDPSEQAPALNRLLGTETLLVLPSAAPPGVRAAWSAFVDALVQRYPNLRSISDAELAAKKPRGNLLILGWDNRLFDAQRGLFEHPTQRLDADGLVLDGKEYLRTRHALVLVENRPDGSSVGLIGADDAATINALGRKLPHYGSFGRMVFERGSAKNLRRDVLSPRQSTLSRQLGKTPVTLLLPSEDILGDSH